MEEEFEFRFDLAYRPLLLAWGATPGNSRVILSEDSLRAEFGFVSLATPYTNIDGIEVTGDYRPWRAIGVRMSLTDRGLTFGSTTAAGTCIRFVQPVRPHPTIFRSGHPGLTVTVAEPERLADRVRELIA